MNVLFDPRVEKWVTKLLNSEKALVAEYIQLFIEFGFNLNQKYLKKIGDNLWELRPKHIRLFFTQVKPNYIIIHGMLKKSQKMTIQTKRILNQRMKDYL